MPEVLGWQGEGMKGKENLDLRIGKAFHWRTGKNFPAVESCQ